MIWKPTCKNIGAEDGKGLSYIPYISDKGTFATIIIEIFVRNGNRLYKLTRFVARKSN